MAVSTPTLLCQPPFLSSAGVTTSGAVAVGAIVPIGQLVVVRCWGATAATTFTVSDSQSNTWTAKTQIGNTGGSALAVQQAFYCFLTTAWTATDTITVTRTASNSLGFEAYTYTGAASVGADITNAVTANNAAVTFGSSLTPGSGDLIDVGIAWSNSTAGTVGSGYTKPIDVTTTVTNARRFAMEYQQFPSGGTNSPTFTCGGSPQWAASAFVVVASGGAASGTGSISLSGSAIWSEPASGSISLSGSAVWSEPASGSISLSGSGVWTEPASGSMSLSGSAVWSEPAAGSVSLSASAGAAAPVSGTGSVALAGTATIGGSPASGTASVTLAGAGAGSAVGTGAGSVSLAGSAGAQGAATGTGSLSLSGAATSVAQATSSAVLSLLGSAAAGVRASASALLSLLGIISNGSPPPYVLTTAPARRGTLVAPAADLTTTAAGHRLTLTPPALDLTLTAPSARRTLTAPEVDA